VDFSEKHFASPNSASTGWRSQHNVLRDKPGPTAHAKRRIVTGVMSTAWRLIIDDSMLKHIQKCTVTEAHRALGNDEWKLSLEDLDAFLGIRYVRGALESKGMELDLLWSEKYGVQLCQDTSRNRFREIMKYLRFDLRAKRSERLKEEKYALISDIWERFI